MVKLKGEKKGSNERNNTKTFLAIILFIVVIYFLINSIYKVINKTNGDQTKLICNIQELIY